MLNEYHIILLIIILIITYDYFEKNYNNNDIKTYFPITFFCEDCTKKSHENEWRYNFYVNTSTLSTPTTLV